MPGIDKENMKSISEALPCTGRGGYPAHLLFYSSAITAEICFPPFAQQGGNRESCISNDHHHCYPKFLLFPHGLADGHWRNIQSDTNL